MLFALHPGPVHLLFVVPLALVITGIFSVNWCRRGYRNIHAEPPMRWRRFKGIVQLVACVLIWPAMCFSPGILFRMNHGTDPIGPNDFRLIQEGMTMAEVQAILGPPIRVDPNGGWVIWRYYSDPLYINDQNFRFDEDGRMDFNWSI